MKKTLFAAGCALAWSVSSSLAVAADIIGTVVNSRGQAVQGSKISVADQNGLVAGNATTDKQGRYSISGLGAGRYDIKLSAAGNDKGETAVSYLDEKGLTVNWAVGSSGSIATAQSGAGHSSSSPLTAIASASAKKTEPPPGCKGMPGPLCGPKSPKH